MLRPNLFCSKGIRKWWGNTGVEYEIEDIDRTFGGTEGRRHGRRQWRRHGDTERYGDRETDRDKYRENDAGESRQTDERENKRGRKCESQHGWGEKSKYFDWCLQTFLSAYTLTGLGTDECTCTTRRLVPGSAGVGRGGLVWPFRSSLCPQIQ